MWRGANCQICTRGWGVVYSWHAGKWCYTDAPQVRPAQKYNHWPVDQCQYRVVETKPLYSLRLHKNSLKIWEKIHHTGSTRACYYQVLPDSGSNLVMDETGQRIGIITGKSLNQIHQYSLFPLITDAWIEPLVWKNVPRSLHWEPAPVYCGRKRPWHRWKPVPVCHTALSVRTSATTTAPLHWPPALA